VVTPAVFSLALASDLVIRGGTVWDGTGAPPRPGDVLVHDDRIAAIGPALEPPAGASVVDATGAFVLPGLIDCHVHLSMDPGAAFRDDGPEERQALLERHLRAYLASGVTTILDPAVAPPESARIRATLASGAPGPRYLTLGAPFSPRGGYPAVVLDDSFPTVGTPAEVERLLDVVVGQGAVGVKATVEPGMALPIWPVYTPEVEAALVAGAAARHLPIWAHAETVPTQRHAIEGLGARVLVHPPNRPDAALVGLARERGVTETSTLAIVDSWQMAWDPSPLDDPWLVARVPPSELATARDRQVARAFRRGVVTTLVPWAPGPGLLGALFLGPRALGRRLAGMSAAVLAMHRAGVPVIMGSDAGNWPLIPYLFHGPSTIREVELLVAAGFTPEEALLAGTRTPAALLDLDAGTLEPGKVADLLVVEGHPLADPGQLRRLRSVVRAGQARPAEGWLEG
jgi:imidazolonepropionase-like amidohydrolase